MRLRVTIAALAGVAALTRCAPFDADEPRSGPVEAPPDSGASGADDAAPGTDSGAGARDVSQPPVEDAEGGACVVDVPAQLLGICPRLTAASIAGAPDAPDNDTGPTAQPLSLGSAVCGGEGLHYFKLVGESACFQVVFEGHDCMVAQENGSEFIANRGSALWTSSSLPVLLKVQDHTGPCLSWKLAVR